MHTSSPRSRPAHRSSGFTILEVLVSMCVLSVAMGSATRLLYNAMQSNQLAIEAATDIEQADAQFERQLADRARSVSAAPQESANRCQCRHR